MARTVTSCDAMGEPGHMSPTTLHRRDADTFRNSTIHARSRSLVIHPFAGFIPRRLRHALPAGDTHAGSDTQVVSLRACVSHNSPARRRIATVFQNACAGTDGLSSHGRFSLRLWTPLGLRPEVDRPLLLWRRRSCPTASGRHGPEKIRMRSTCVAFLPFRPFKIFGHAFRLFLPFLSTTCMPGRTTLFWHT